jgi:hypothetical protein
MEASHLDRALRRGLFAEAAEHALLPVSPAGVVCSRIQRRWSVDCPELVFVHWVLKKWMPREGLVRIPRVLINYIIFNCGLHRFFLHEKHETLRQQRIWCMTQLDVEPNQTFLIKNLKQMIRFLQLRQEHSFPRMLPNTRMWLRFIMAYDELLEEAFPTRAP